MAQIYRFWSNAIMRVHC